MFTDALSECSEDRTTASRLRVLLREQGIAPEGIDGDRIAPIYEALRRTGSAAPTETRALESLLPDTPPAADPSDRDDLWGLIVETRRHRNLVSIVEQVARLGVRVQIYHGTKNERFIRRSSLRESIEDGRIVLTRMRTPALSASTYNGLLLSRRFWEAARGRGRILVFQTDAILCRASPYGIADFLSFDYIGATWPVRRPVGLVCHGGNGGLSLRDWSRAVECLERFPAARWPGGEDGYFAFHIELAGGRVAAPEDCGRFATQSRFTDRSFGAHRISLLAPEDRARFLDYCPEARSILDPRDARPLPAPGRGSA